MEQKTTQEKHDRAKYKLAASIKECMKTTPVDRITVKDIVEGSGLTRQTFYRNFKDKYDLINWYFDKLVLQSFEQIGMGNTVGESLTQKFEFILNEKAFFTEAFRSDDYNSVKEHDFELILQFYKDLIARKTSRPLEEEMEFLLEMYCRGSVYMTEKWVLGACRTSWLKPCRRSWRRCSRSWSFCEKADDFVNRRKPRNTGKMIQNLQWKL